MTGRSLLIFRFINSSEIEAFVVGKAGYESMQANQMSLENCDFALQTRPFVNIKSEKLAQGARNY